MLMLSIGERKDRDSSRGLCITNDEAFAHRHYVVHVDDRKSNGLRQVSNFLNFDSLIIGQQIEGHL
jgi:hypothetical protein